MSINPVHSPYMYKACETGNVPQRKAAKYFRKGIGHEMQELTTVQNEQSQRLEVKLRRELGETILSLLDDNGVEDIVLNPDATLWVKQMGSGFTRVGQMSGSQAV